MTKQDTPWEWGSLQQAAFDGLKEAITTAPVLILPDQAAAASGASPYRVQTDASQIALGGVLMQDQGQGWRPIAFESRQFKAAEQNYHTGERELCAIWHCCTVAWRHYLIFTPFELQDDHKPLHWLMSPNRDLSRRQARWYYDLVEVGVVGVKHVPGVTIPVPDALSRRPDYVE